MVGAQGSGYVMGPVSKSELGRLLRLPLRAPDNLRFLVGRASGSLAPWSSPKPSSPKPSSLSRVFGLGLDVVVVIRLGRLVVVLEDESLVARFPAIVKHSLFPLRQTSGAVVCKSGGTGDFDATRCFGFNVARRVAPPLARLGNSTTRRVGWPGWPGWPGPENKQFTNRPCPRNGEGTRTNLAGAMTSRPGPTANVETQELTGNLQLVRRVGIAMLVALAEQRLASRVSQISMRWTASVMSHPDLMHKQYLQNRPFDGEGGEARS